MKRNKQKSEKKRSEKNFLCVVTYPFFIQEEIRALSFSLSEVVSINIQITAAPPYNFDCKIKCNSNKTSLGSQSNCLHGSL